MAAGSTISPERCSFPSVQRRHREETKKYQSVMKRSSKDWYPPEMAFVRSRLCIRRMIMDRKPQWTGHKDALDTCQELEGYLEHLENIFAFKLANEEKQVLCSSSDRKQSARHAHLPDLTVTAC